MYSFSIHPSYPLESKVSKILLSDDPSETNGFYNWDCMIADGERLCATITARKRFGEGREGFPFVETPEEGRRIAVLMAASGDLVNGVNALLGLLQLLMQRDDMPAQIVEEILLSHRTTEALNALARAGYPFPEDLGRFTKGENPAPQVLDEPAAPVAVPEVTRRGALDMQICVPSTFSDEQAVDFANSDTLCGTDSGWQIVRTGDRHLAGQPERVPCETRSDYVHIMVCA